MKRSICESQGAEFDSVDHRRAKKRAGNLLQILKLAELKASMEEEKKEKVDEA